ncbi:MAG: hypothetical protein U0166_15390 [Acidobacteriota bacterium]
MVRRSFALPLVLALLTGGPSHAQEAPGKRDASLPELPGTTARVPWSDFLRILEELQKGMKPPAPVPEPPQDYAVSRATLLGEVAADGKSVRFQLGLELYVLTSEHWAQIPLFGEDAAVSDATVGTAAAPLYAKDGQLWLALRGKGPVTFKATFATRVNETQGERSTSFQSFRAPATAFTLTIPEVGLEVEPSQGVVSEKREEGGKTIATLAIPPTTNVTVTWRKGEKEAEKAGAGAGEGKAQAEVRTLVTVGEGVMSATSAIDYKLYQRKLTELFVALPKDVRLLEAQGAGIGKTEEEESGNERVVHVTLDDEVSDAYHLTLLYEKELAGASAQVGVPLVTVRNVDRQTGWVAVAAAGSVEVTEAGALTGLTTLDISELPLPLGQMSQSAILYAYRYIRVPYEGTLQVTRHEDVQVKQSLVEKATVQSFYVKDGKVLTHVCWQVKNNQKQYLKVTLPAGAEVWSTFLSGKPVKAGKEGGAVLLPLEKTKGGAEGGRSFPVEMVYAEEGRKLWPVDRRSAEVPAIDLDAMEMEWELYLPSKWVYSGFTGDLQKVSERPYTAPPPAPPVPHTVEEETREADRLSSNELIENGPAQAGQTTTSPETRRAGEARGVLPVKVELPLEGIQVRLSKNVVSAGEKPAVSFRLRRSAGALGGSSVFLFVIAFVFGASCVIVLRHGSDEVTRRQALVLLALAIAIALFYRKAGETPAPLVWGAGIPVLYWLLRQARGKTVAAALLIACVGISARADQDPMPATPAPPDLPDSSLAIPWGDMKKLMEQMLKAQEPEKPPVKPPVTHAVTRASLSGNVASDGKTATFTLSLDVEVLEPEEWIQIPLFDDSLAMTTATLDDGPAPLSNAGGPLALVLRGTGTHRFAGTFSVPVGKSQGVRSLYFLFPKVPVSRVTLTVPEAGIEVTDPSGGVTLERREEGGKSISTIALLSRNQVTLQWQKKKDEGASTVEGKIQAEVKTLVTVGEGVMSCQSVIDYKLFQKKARALAVAIPEKAVLLDVQGYGLLESHDAVEGGARVVRASLSYEAEQSYQLTVTYEISLGGASGKGPLPDVRVQDVDRQNGWIAVAAKSNVEVAEEGEAKDLSALDPSELPSDLRERSTTAVLYAYRYIKVPYEAGISVTRHEDQELKRSIIDSATLTSFAGEDGKVLTRVEYSIRNNQKQFLRVKLPAGGTVWGTYVSGRPVKAAKDKDGSLLVPLEKSRVGVENMKPFPVEVVYYQAGRRFLGLWRNEARAPVTDLECLAMSWRLYLPWQYAIYRFGGELEAVEEKPVLPADGTVGLPEAEDHKPARREEVPEKLKNQGYLDDSLNNSLFVEEGKRGDQVDAITGGYNAAVGRSGGAKGVLPVRVTVPTDGQTFDFGKKVVKAGETPGITYWYLAQRARASLDYVLFFLSAIFATLALSALKASRERRLGGRRLVVMLGCLAAIAAIRFLALGTAQVIFVGALIPVALHMVYFVLRRTPDRLSA